MKPNMIFVIIKGSVDEAEAEASRRGLTLNLASKNPKFNETLGYIDISYEYDAEKRIRGWFNEWGKLDEGAGYSPGTLLWFTKATITDPATILKEKNNA